MNAHSLLIRTQQHIRHKKDLKCNLTSQQYTKATPKEMVELVDEAVLAVVVYKQSFYGCVRVVGETVKNILTDPEIKDDELLVYIGKGEKCFIYGQPSMRFYKQSDKQGHKKSDKKSGKQGDKKSDKQSDKQSDEKSDEEQ